MIMMKALYMTSFFTGILLDRAIPLFHCRFHGYRYLSSPVKCGLYTNASTSIKPKTIANIQSKLLKRPVDTPTYADLGA